MKKTIKLLLLSVFSVSILSACGPDAPSLNAPDGTKLEGDKAISGKVTGDKVSDKTKILLFGHFNNVSGNKIDAQNETVEGEVELGYALVAEGKYNFALPKAPSKANTVANLKVFAFNDDNDNNKHDDGELKSKEAQVRWAVGVGYASGRDVDGNEVPLGKFEDFNFKLESES